MRIVGNHFAQFGAGNVGLIARHVNFRELNFGARIRVIFGDLFPEVERTPGVAKGRAGFRERHLGIAVVVLGIFGDDAFQERFGFGRAFGAQEALAEVGAGVDVLRVAFHGGAIALLGFVEFALLEINIAELGVMMRLVQMMNFGLEILDATAVHRAGQFEAARGGRRVAINENVVAHRGNEPAEEDESGPNPFASADGVDEHPQLKDANQQNKGGRNQPITDVEKL